MIIFFDMANLGMILLKIKVVSLKHINSMREIKHLKKHL